MKKWEVSGGVAHLLHLHQSIMCEYRRSTSVLSPHFQYHRGGQMMKWDESVSIAHLALL